MIKSRPKPPKHFLDNYHSGNNYTRSIVKIEYCAGDVMKVIGECLPTISFKSNIIQHLIKLAPEFNENGNDITHLLYYNCETRNILIYLKKKGINFDNMPNRFLYRNCILREFIYIGANINLNYD